MSSRPDADCGAVSGAFTYQVLRFVNPGKATLALSIRAAFVGARGFIAAYDLGFSPGLPSEHCRAGAADGGQGAALDLALGAGERLYLLVTTSRAGEDGVDWTVQITAS